MNIKSLRSVGWHLPVIAAVLGVTLTLVLTFQLIPSRYDLREGDVSQDTIKSPARVSFISQVLTNEERDLAEAQVQEVTKQDRAITNAQISLARANIARIASILSTPEIGLEKKEELLLGMPEVSLSAEAASTLLNLSPGGWPIVQSEVLRLVETTMQWRIYTLELDTVKRELESRVTRILPANQVSAIAQLASSFIRPNVIQDEEGTRNTRKDAREAVAPMRLTIEKGQTIIRDGDVVTAVHMEKLEASGLLRPRLQWEDLAGTGLPAALLVLLMAIYLHIYEGGLRYHPRRLIALAIIIIVTVVAAKLTIPTRDYFAFIFPMAAAPMLVGLLISTPAAMLSAVLLSVAIGFVGATDPLQLVIVHLLAGLAGCLLLRRAGRLASFFVAGAGVAVMSFFGTLAFSWMAQDAEVSRLGSYAFLSIVNGGLSSILTLGTMALLGLAFGLDTPIHLMELAHPNQKLLRQLAMEAPGTYHHSILVANLAERAAEAVGADALLVRVGAYYHDIGKTIHPGFFIENQANGENVHDCLEPDTSARLVTAHVEEGLQLARRHRLPRQVQELIAQHHGSRLVTYFYHRACQRGETDAESFRYPGQRPQTKEAAILLLADTVEAAARAMKDHSAAKLESVVDNALAQNLADGQLDDCDVTLKELERIKQSLKATIKGAYHPRITYPASTNAVGTG